MASNGPATHVDLHDEKKPLVDWAALRKRSLQPGGFGPSRVEIWPQLLNANMPPIAKEIEVEEEEEPAEHQDERQIRLDTDRSFVLYPVGTRLEDREAMQARLNRLLVSVFRRRPKLRYFQGYHDIVSVLFLTLPPELQFVCVEKISLHRVRDSMGSTLEPVLGLLRVTKNLLRLADRVYAQDLERTSPLPFYALSNLLTLFSHDMPTLPLIQHVFDYILCRPPIIVVYLATAIILSRKAEIRRLEAQDEDEGMGMAHSVLSSMPQMSDGEEMRNVGMEVDEKALLAEVKVVLEDEAEVVRETAAERGERRLDQALPVKIDDDADELTVVPPEQSSLEAENEEPFEIPLKVEERKEDVSGATGDAEEMNLEPQIDVELDEKLPDNVAAELAGKEELSPTPTPPSSSFRPASPPPPLPASPQPPSVTLTSLLTHADTLYALYPPTHPALCLSSIMGPQSVVHTWSEVPASLPADDEAEAMVGQPGLVVYPYIEDDDEEGEGEWNDEKTKGKRKKRGKKRARLRRLVLGERRTRAGTGTMVAGAVLVLGVAMAVYGVRMRGNGSVHVGAGAGVYGLGIGAADARQGREWRKVVGWVGGAVVGVTERVLSGLSSSSR